ncbi:hypothetical protein SAMN04487985_1082 [Aerococcus urinaehominis]|uniref:bacteriocin n=1 Tax=Aerococcus urinaehominis TaxID=128944 RepID=UPI00088DE50E|nr:bacteriocin [Aerococcus urinaehominis]SDM18864.1 hypothetical protein SAMN04487985_1082 [Aerococcus urinaehominis]
MKKYHTLKKSELMQIKAGGAALNIISTIGSFLIADAWRHSDQIREGYQQTRH